MRNLEHYARHSFDSNLFRDTNKDQVPSPPPDESEFEHSDIQIIDTARAEA